MTFISCISGHNLNSKLTGHFTTLIKTVVCHNTSAGLPPSCLRLAPPKSRHSCPKFERVDIFCVLFFFRWITKHFDRVLGTKGFATLPNKLQEDILTEIKKSFVSSLSNDIL